MEPGLHCREKWILGLDLGANSVGWAAIRAEEDDEGRLRGAGLLDLGARVFEAGMEGNLDQGREESRNLKRRNMRQQRRQTDRRRRRMNKLWNLLAKLGFLPKVTDSEKRGDLIAEMDRGLAAKHGAHENLPYVLRAKALTERLEPEEFGRVLFHLAQRRGFLSNRKQQKDGDDEKGEVKTGIKELAGQMQHAGSQTIGAHFASINPHRERIRDRWTHRNMFLEEFDKIWARQAEFHPGLCTEGNRSKVRQTIFHQRPLRDQAELIGDCELEPGEKRAPLWHPVSQRFRMLKNLNNLKLVYPTLEERDLEDQERETLKKALESGDLSWAAVKNALGIKKQHVEFNLQKGGEKKLIGDRTRGKLKSVLVNEWPGLSPADLEEAAGVLAGEVKSIETDEQAAAWAQQRWGLNAERADQFAGISLETNKYRL